VSDRSGVGQRCRKLAHSDRCCAASVPRWHGIWRTRSTSRGRWSLRCAR